jgi:hypothetical protein
MSALRTLAQSAAKVRFPPFTSKCAWCSNLTASYLIIIPHSPKLSLAECPNTALQNPAHIDSGSAVYDGAVCADAVIVRMHITPQIPSSLARKMSDVGGATANPSNRTDRASDKNFSSGA